MNFYSCSTECTLGDFARANGMTPRDIWLPLDAARSRATGRCSVKATTPLILVHTQTGESVSRRTDIMLRLGLPVQDSQAMNLDPRRVPEGYTLYVRWDRPGGKSLRAGTVVLHRPLTHTQALTEGSISGVSLENVTDGKKRSRSEAASLYGSVDASTLAEKLREGRGDVSLRSRADLEARLQTVLATTEAAVPSGSDSARSEAAAATAETILAATIANIKRRKGERPLHFVIPTAEETVVFVDHMRWHFGDHRVLHRVFRPSVKDSTVPGEQADISTYADTTRQLLLVFIEDIISHRYSAEVVRVEEEKDVTGTVDHAILAARLRDYANRGFRIVMIEQFPSLHHGNVHHLRATLEPIATFCTTHCADFTVSVTLSVMSNINSVQRGGGNSSFVLPNNGLYQYFVSNCNAGLHTDERASLVVGTGEKGSPFLQHLHRDFARNVSLRYVDVEEFLHTEVS